jgi:hypothetical protein
MSSKHYEAAIAITRKTGGDEKESHCESRLKAVMKRRAQHARKSATR